MKQTRGHDTAAIEKSFCCSIANCLSRDGQPRPFSSQKLLTQHFIKVHAEKKYPCSKCGKKFGAEWLSKHHESTCGTLWHCSCKAIYQNREALLTHARRQMHTLPFKLKRGDTCKRKQASSQAVQQVIVPVATQVIILMQNQKVGGSEGVRQAIACRANKNTCQWRSIVPKVTDISSLLTASTASALSSTTRAGDTFVNSEIANKVHQASQTNVSWKFKRTKDSCIQASTRAGCTRDASELVDLPPKACRRSRAMKTAVETQTSGLDIHTRDIQPRTSELSSHVKKSSYGCSIHTQTVESAVCKAKRTRAKRAAPKQQPSKMDKEIATSELWSDLDELLFQGRTAAPSREWMEFFPRSSSATQTLEPDALFKDMCNYRSSTARESGSVFPRDLGEQQESFNQQRLLPDPLEEGLNVISRKETMLPVLASVEEPNGCLGSTLGNVIFSSETQTDNLLDSLLLTSVQQSAAQTDFPLFSHNETQTSEDVPLECTDVLHMETQTSGWLFGDFESVDIETQTPWEHLDFSFDDLVTDDNFTKKKDAESQIECCQLKRSWAAMKLCNKDAHKGCNNMETQTNGLF